MKLKSANLISSVSENGNNTFFGGVLCVYIYVHICTHIYTCAVYKHPHPHTHTCGRPVSPAAQLQVQDLLPGLAICTGANGDGIAHGASRRAAAVHLLMSAAGCCLVKNIVSCTYVRCLEDTKTLFIRCLDVFGWSRLPSVLNRTANMLLKQW